MGQNRRTLNLWVAYFMPLVMVAMVGYATWVFVSLVCLRYLLRERKRTKTVGVLLGVYGIIFLLLLASYVRIVMTLTVNPGYVKRGPGANQTKRIGQKSQIDGSASEDDDVEAGLGSGGGGRDGLANDGSATTTSKSPSPLPQRLTPAATRVPRPSASAVSHISMSGALPQTHASRAAVDAALVTQGRPYSWSPMRPRSKGGPRNLKEFLDKEIFACESDGLPRYCVYCDCWKPDRSHHCSEVGRCVMKMDHFCPWVGGVVAESSFRYFYQVVAYGALYCVFVVITIAVFLHERNKDRMGIEATWVAALALAAVFGTFSTGMALSTTQMIYNNLSTIDSLSAQTKVYQLAIHDPHPPPPSVTQLSDCTPTVPRVWLPPNPAPGEERRCYAIVRTAQGENPWKLDSAYENFKESLGGGFWKWFLLWGVPKAGSQGGAEGWYRWNPTLIARLKKEAGIQTKHHNEKV